MQQTHLNKKKEKKTLGFLNKKDENRTIEIVSSTPYKINNALNLESTIKVTIVEIVYLRLPSMQSCSRVTFPLLQTIKKN